MDSLLVDIDQEGKEELISLLRRRFSSVDQIRSGTRIPYSNLVQHEDGELEKMGLQNLGDLLATVNMSKSRFQGAEADSEDFVEKKFDYTPPRVQLADGLQETVFRAFSVDEVDENSDVSRQTVNRIRNGDSSRIPQDMYQEFFERLDSELETDVEFDASVEFAGNGGELMEADQEQVLDLYFLRERIRDLAENRPQAREAIKSNIDMVPEILESDETYFGGDNYGESLVYNVLGEFDLMEYWAGNNDLYMVDAPEPYFQVFTREFRDMIDESVQERYSTGELLFILDSAADELGEAPAENFFDDDDDLPSANTYKNRFGSWNNALWRLGLETREHEYPEEQLLQYVFEKYHEKGERPERADVVTDPDAPSINAFEDPDEGYRFEDFLDDAGIPDVESMLDMRWYSRDQPEYPESSNRNLSEV